MSLPALNARQRNPSHLGSNCQPDSRGTSSTRRASIGLVSSGTGSAERASCGPSSYVRGFGMALIQPDNSAGGRLRSPLSIGGAFRAELGVETLRPAPVERAEFEGVGLWH